MRESNRSDGFGLVRLTSWATAAAVAVAAAAMTTFTTTGSERLAMAMNGLAGDDEIHETQAIQQAQALQLAEIDSERRSLKEALRLLATDRDRLMTRVGSLERNLDDITGSIKSQTERPKPETTSMPVAPPEIETPPTPTASVAPTPAKPSANKPADMPEWLAKTPEPWPNPSAGKEFAPGPKSLSFPRVTAAPAPAPAPPVHVSALPLETTPAATAPAANARVAARTDFGVDIGSGASLEEVRALWNAARSQHASLLGNLRPIIVKREDPTGNTDYRLVVGPLANADAAKLCAALGNADVMCSTRAYQGERLKP